MAFTVGKWTEVGEKENFDAIMKAFGVEGDMKKQFLDSKETMEYSWDPEKEELTMIETSTMYPGKESKDVTKIGTEFKSKALGGSSYKATVTIPSGKTELHQKVMNEDFGEMTAIRKFTKDTMLLEVIKDGITMKINFKKVE